MSRPSSQWPRQSYAPSLGFSTMLALLSLFTNPPVKVLDSWCFWRFDVWVFQFLKVWLLGCFGVLAFRGFVEFAFRYFRKNNLCHMKSSFQPLSVQSNRPRYFVLTAFEKRIAFSQSWFKHEEEMKPIWLFLVEVRKKKVLICMRIFHDWRQMVQLSTLTLLPIFYPPSLSLPYSLPYSLSLTPFLILPLFLYSKHANSLWPTCSNPLSILHTYLHTYVLHLAPSLCRR